LLVHLAGQAGHLVDPSHIEQVLGLYASQRFDGRGDKSYSLLVLLNKQVGTAEREPVS
jgi:hypothetical protein